MFIQADIGKTLATLTPRAAGAFAAACAERLILMYESFRTESDWDPDEVVRSVLDRVWSCLESGAPKECYGLKDVRGAVEAMAPNADDFESNYVVPAQNCVICVDIALRNLSDEGFGCVAASQYAVEAIVSIELWKATGYLAAGDEARLQAKEQEIMQGKEVQTELRCQVEDAGALATHGTSAETIRAVRRQAVGSRYRSD